MSVVGSFSGGHLNPAITVAMAFLGRLGLVQMIVYWIAQYVGAFLGSACVYGIYSGRAFRFYIYLILLLI